MNKEEKEIQDLRYVLKLLHDLIHTGEELARVGMERSSSILDPYLEGFVSLYSELVAGKIGQTVSTIAVARLRELGYEVSSTLDEEAFKWEINEILSRGMKGSEEGEE